jgi:NAD(P)-dependent dehydrogenase (short-subunit alcohol dehydrogenase family)
MADLKIKNALVTGAGKRIGKQALALAKRCKRYFGTKEKLIV